MQRGICFVLACVVGACSFSPRLSGTADGAGSAVHDAAAADAPDTIDAAATHDAQVRDASVPIDAARDASVIPADAAAPACGGVLQACCEPGNHCDAPLKCGQLLHVCVVPL